MKNGADNAHPAGVLLRSGQVEVSSGGSSAAYCYLGSQNLSFLIKDGHPIFLLIYCD